MAHGPKIPYPWNAGLGERREIWERLGFRDPLRRNVEPAVRVGLKPWGICINLERSVVGEVAADFWNAEH